MRSPVIAAWIALAALAGGGAGTRAVAQSADPGAEQNKALFTVVVDQILNQGDVALADALIAENVSKDGAPLGREGYKAMVKEMRAKTPEARFAIADLVADGDRVIGRLTETGAPGGPASEIMILRIRDGQVTETWTLADEPGIRKQLGLEAATAGPSSAN